jgi:hypothetical protein
MAVRYAEPTAFPPEVGWGMAVQIRWQSSDSAALGSLFPTPTGSTQAAASDGGGLSAGAIAGIVVGAAAFLALVILAAWVVFRQKRRQHSRAAVELWPRTAGGPGELDTVPASGGAPPVEVPGWVHQEGAELASDIAIVRSVELPTGGEKEKEETIESLLVRKAELDDEQKRLYQRLSLLQQTQPPAQRYEAS